MRIIVKILLFLVVNYYSLEVLSQRTLPDYSVAELSDYDLHLLDSCTEANETVSLSDSAYASQLVFLCNNVEDEDLYYELEDFYFQLLLTKRDVSDYFESLYLDYVKFDSKKDYLNYIKGSDLNNETFLQWMDFIHWNLDEDIPLVNVDGIITSSQGGRLADVKIEVRNKDSLLYVTKTDFDGKYEFLLRNEWYNVEFIKAGHIKKRIIFDARGLSDLTLFEVPIQLDVTTGSTELDELLSNLPIGRLEYDESRDAMIIDQGYSKNAKKSYLEIQEVYLQKLQADSLAASQKLEGVKKQSELDQKKSEQKYLFLGLGLLIAFLALLVARFRKTQKQNKIIASQKQEVEHAHAELEESHKEITDSINYAERIQRSFLATKEVLDEHLKDYFVFFKPKEAVSGDFYWAAELNDGNFAWSCADSTGHGVPGAIMSLLNISSLEKSIETETSPEKILGKTREIIINRLKKDGSAEGGKDGMDCNLLVINKDRSQLTFASAHNPVIIVRGEELIEYKGDKIPVGKHDRDSESFTLQIAQLQKGDVIYALTDGFPDQFGGPKGKKYMIKNLKKKFVEIASLPMSEQNKILEQEFEQWKQQNEQIDDVCIIGVRV